MAKIFMSLGFWMTIVLFVALGYAFGSECWGSNCSDGRSPFTSPLVQDENHLRASDAARRCRCAPYESPRSSAPDFQQMANLQGGAPTYALGLSFTMTRRSPQMTICSGPIEIPRH